MNLIRRLPLPPRGLESLGVRLGVLAFWTVVGVLETAKEIATAGLSGVDRSLTDAIMVNFPWWFFWAPATVMVMAVAQRFPLSEGRTPARAGVHALVAVVVSVAHLTGVALLVWLTVTRGGDFVQSDPSAAVRGWLTAYGVMDFLIYWLVLGAGHAFLFHRRYADGRVREARLEARAARSESAAHLARLQALRMELRPHFLFNALNSAAGLVEEGRGEAARTVILRLSTLLRETLEGSPTQEVPLRREVELVDRYLDIERVRFGDRLRVSVRVDPASEEALVPPFILQPLVENAVHHGVARAPGPASIVVEAEIVGERVALRVANDGPGPLGEIDEDREGVGLRNVRGRLAALYGDEARLRLRPGDTGGCVADLEIPLRRLPAAAAAHG